MKEIQTITKLRAKASTLRADLALRHLLPPNQSSECRHCGHEKEDAEHVINECESLNSQREDFHRML